MNHLLVCREYPPAAFPPGGVGTYVKHIARLMAEAGETVHVIAQRWEGAPLNIAESCGGKLVVHRVALDHPVHGGAETGRADATLLQGMENSDCPSQIFSWQVARVVESLVQAESIDVIEAPEWEAPLYYFQLRRALGLGPRRQPPCLIHLHSPSALIFRYNNWDRTLTDFQPLCRFEEYTARAADALICPSRYLAAGAEQLFDLPPDQVNVIPYPIGDTPAITRTGDVWARDSVCYVGRLELRKGIVEWVDAAVEVAGSHPAVTFDFIGSDTSLNGTEGQSVREYLKRRIPRALQPRFRFYGNKTRAEVLTLLGESPFAVVPSRWENLPYSCIEAMCTGLPVLASRDGGMAELVTDGESGWLVPHATSPALASTLRRMLETPPAERMAMGRQAAQAVRRICANQSVLQRHLELRARLARAGATRSRLVPVAASSLLSGPPVAAAAGADGRQGIGVVLTCLGDPELLPGCLESIRPQLGQAGRVVVVAHERLREAVELARRRYQQSCSVTYISNAAAGTAPAVGAKMLLAGGPPLRGILFLSEDARLKAHSLRACETVFESQPQVGVISFWVQYGKVGSEVDLAQISPSGCPLDEGLRCVAVRAETLAGERGFGVVGREWAAVTYPELLVSLRGPADRRTDRRSTRPRRYSVMALTQRRSAKLTMNRFLTASVSEKLRWLQRAFQQPRLSAQWLGWQARSAAGKALNWR